MSDEKILAFREWLQGHYGWEGVCRVRGHAAEVRVIGAQATEDVDDKARELGLVLRGEWEALGFDKELGFGMKRVFTVDRAEAKLEAILADEDLWSEGDQSGMLASPLVKELTACWLDYIKTGGMTGVDFEANFLRDLEEAKAYMDSYAADVLKAYRNKEEAA